MTDDSNIVLDGYKDVGAEAATDAWPRVIDYKTFDWSSQTPSAAPDFEKLHGWDVFRALGSPQRILAPMVEGSALPVRLMLGTLGFDACWTPMFHARLYADDPNYRDPLKQCDTALLPSSLVYDAPGNTARQLAIMRERLNDRSAALGLTAGAFGGQNLHLEEKPLVVQFAGNSPAAVLRAVRQLEALVFDDHGVRRPAGPPVHAVEINMGCPQRIARRGYYGSFIQENWSLCFALIRELHLHSRFPVCAKIRVLPEDTHPYPDTRRYVRMLIDAGASIVTVHGRRRTQRGQNKGPCDARAIKAAVEEAAGEIPIVYNGGVECEEQAVEAMTSTGAAAVMVGDGALTFPAMCASRVPNLTPEARAHAERSDPKCLDLAHATVARCLAAQYLVNIYRAIYEPEIIDDAGINAGISDFGDQARAIVRGVRDQLLARRAALLAGAEPAPAPAAGAARAAGVPDDVRDRMLLGDELTRATLVKKVINAEIRDAFDVASHPEFVPDGTPAQARAGLTLAFFSILENDLARHPDLRAWASSEHRPMGRLGAIAAALAERCRVGEVSLAGIEQKDLLSD